MTDTTQPLNMTVLELKGRLDQAEPTAVLDVREPDEWAAGHIDGALHIPLGELTDRLAELPSQGPIVCYCHHGGRSSHAQELLGKNNVKEVYNLTGGIDAWSREVDPSIPLY